MSQAQEYLLNSNQYSAERLEIQHLLYEKGSQQLLLDARFNSEMKVLEVGCGTGQ